MIIFKLKKKFNEHTSLHNLDISSNVINLNKTDKISPKRIKIKQIMSIV